VGAAHAYIPIVALALYAWTFATYNAGCFLSRYYLVLGALTPAVAVAALPLLYVLEHHSREAFARAVQRRQEAAAAAAGALSDSCDKKGQ
jgi:hypothetical protein